MRIKWHSAPSEDDYDSADHFLSLSMKKLEAQATVDRLRQSKIHTFYAKDILRGSGLPILSPDDPYVQEDLAKIKTGLPFSPILLVRGKARKGLPLIIADGYHRVCTVFHMDPDNMIPCHIADLKKMK